MEGMQWKGLWVSTISYEIGDVVYFQNDGFTYICVRKNRPGFPPDNFFSGFELMAGFNVDFDPIDGGEF